MRGKTNTPPTPKQPGGSIHMVCSAPVTCGRAKLRRIIRSSKRSRSWQLRNNTSWAAAALLAATPPHCQPQPLRLPGEAFPLHGAVLPGWRAAGGRSLRLARARLQGGKSVGHGAYREWCRSVSIPMCIPSGSLQYENRRAHLRQDYGPRHRRSDRGAELGTRLGDRLGGQGERPDPRGAHGLGAHRRAHARRGVGRRHPHHPRRARRAPPVKGRESA